MKKKFIILTITGLLLASLAACGGSKTPDASKNTADQEAQNQNQDSQGTSDTIQGDIEENHGSDDTEGSSDSAENASENQSGDLTFADLAKYSFEFCSGAGGWSTDFEIEKMALSRDLTMILIWETPGMTMRMERCISAAFQENLLI